MHDLRGAKFLHASGLADGLQLDFDERPRKRLWRKIKFGVGVGALAIPDLMSHVLLFIY